MSAPANIAQGQLMPVRELAPGGKFLNKNSLIKFVPPNTTRTLNERQVITYPVPRRSTHRLLLIGWDFLGQFRNF